MAHTCDACVVTCEDFRLHMRGDGGNVIGDFIASLGCDCDLVTRGGAVQDIVRPLSGYDDSLLRDIRVSVELHRVKTIYLINHDDCGAYGDMDFEDKQDELARHNTDLDEAERIILRNFPSVRVVKLLALLVEGSCDKYVIGLIQ